MLPITKALFSSTASASTGGGVGCAVMQVEVADNRFPCAQ